MHRYQNRRFMRVSVSVPVTLASGGESLSGVIQNLSMVGMYVRSEVRPPIGSPCKAVFWVDPEKPIEVQGAVVYVEREGMAIGFTGIARFGFENLRELIVMRADDPHAADTEIVEKMDLTPDWY